MSREKQIDTPTNTPTNTPTENQLTNSELKQIEEMASIASQCITSWLNNETPKALPDYIVEAIYNAGYRKQEWISVDERLPEKFTDVLCLYPSKNYGSNIVVDYMESDRGIFAEQFKYGPPTHWMPLPEAPKTKGGAE